MDNEKYKIGNTVLKVRDESDLPPHISYNEYLSLLNAVENNQYPHFINRKIIPYQKDRDKLLIQMLWNLGGRISDVINIKREDIDFKNKIITMFVKKRHGFVNKIPVSDDLLLSTSLFLNKYNVNNRLFDFSRQNAWKIIHNYGLKIGLELHPHMFRHGLAIYLLQHGVNDKIIARRLGHSSSLTTIKYYMVITPDLEREMLKGILL